MIKNYNELKTGGGVGFKRKDNVYIWFANLILLIFIGTFSSSAQVATGYTYSLTTGTYSALTTFTSVSAVANLTSGTSDDGNLVVTLPFTFTFNSATYTQVTMNTNGWVGMGSQSPSAANGRTPGNMFTNTNPNNLIGAFFRDGNANFGSGGSLRHGSGGTGIYVLEYNNVTGNDFTTSTTILLNFQVWLYGPTSATPGRIEIKFGPRSGAITSSGAAVGLGGTTTDYFNAVSGNSTATTLVTSFPAINTLARFTPLAATSCATLVSPADTATNVALTGNSVTLSWTAPATGPTATSYDVYLGTTAGAPVLLGNTAATSVSVNGIVHATTYYWKIVAKSATNPDATGCSIFSFTTGNPYLPYCSSITYSSAIEPITSVNFAGINNASSATLNGSTALENFISVTGNVTTANNYNITLKGDTDGNFTDNFSVFFDWNHDGDFADAGETYAAGSVVNSTGIDAVQAVTAIAVPEAALAGATRMRVKKLYNIDTGAVTNPCTGGQYGQSEDYTVNVTACTPTTWYVDADGDTYGNPAVTQSKCLQPVGYVSNSGDCNDADATKHATFPFYVDADGDTFGAGSLVSVCAVNGTTVPSGYSLNNTDCNDADNTKQATFSFFVDADNDGFGSTTASVQCAVNATTAPAGYSVNNTDCNDADNTKHATFSFFVDADGDGFGSTTASVQCAVNATTAPAGYSVNNTDCNDGDNTKHATFSFFVDADNDGFGSTTASVQCAVNATTAPAGYSVNNTDCNDADNTKHATFSFFVDADNDGFGSTTTSVQCAVDANTPPAGYSVNNTDCNDNDGASHQTFQFYADADGDTYGAGSLVSVCTASATIAPAGYSLNNTDCNDNDNAVNQTFQFYADADGDAYGAGSLVSVCTASATIAPAGYSLNNTDCNDADAAVYQSQSLFVDADGDTYDNGSQTICYGASVPTGYALTSSGPDCNDNSNSIHQTFPFYADADGDTYGAGSLVPVCTASGTVAPAGYSLDNTDCNDNSNAVHQTFQFYADADGDTYGAGSLTAVCTASGTIAPAGYSLNNTDCNDGDNTVYQSGTFFVDADNDGYTTGATAIVCYGAATPSGYALTNIGIDCNDAVGAIHPNATEVAYNGIDDDCDGLVDEGFPQITTSLLASDCNSTLASIGSLIGITTLAPGAAYTGYRVRATLGAQVQVIETNVPHFTMQEFASYAYATTYTIDIQLQRNGVWLGYYGPTCQVSTPAILAQNGAGQISPSQCGITLPKINTLIATTSLAGVTGYRFRVTNLTDVAGPNAVQTIDRTQNWFSLQMLTRYNYGTTYRIEVSVKSGTGAFGGFGSPCEVSSPPAPSLVNCGGVVASGTAYISATSVAGATQYRFQITRQSDLAASTIDRNTNYFIFNSVPAAVASPGVLYAVRVAVMTAGTWSPFGDACEITSPGTAARYTPTAPTESTAFKATAYPNPFASEFAIDVTTSSDANVQVKVYDMLGKLIESREVKVSELDAQKVGDRYPSGVYNVIVSQGGIVKTLRVIKR